ncbi:hypothetical protein OsJ_10965 [Oryza sativa Japonica Group]|uniref:F-box domain-containing protein n=1 Tax=Oryza sativa subsp. japonica TaxID=39947 RepID=B9F8K9_ORYSJ|nr:hypothetical protein OsJ_10965 [Oryza sativa Japonica Group]
MDLKKANNNSNKRQRKSTTTTTSVVGPDNGGLPPRRSSRIAERKNVVKRARHRHDGEQPATSRCSQLSGEMPDEMVLELLARLPVKSLLRLRAVSRPWRAAICAPSFVAAHLRRSAARHRWEPTLLIAPQLLDDARARHHMADQLLRHHPPLPMAAAAQRTDGGGAGRCRCQCQPNLQEKLPWRVQATGFGHDPHTGTYKVARCFVRSGDGVVPESTTTGMELCTIGGNGGVSVGSCWREIVADTPYPVLVWHTATFFRGALFFTTCHDTAARPPQESRLLRLCLRDETFSVVAPPPPCRPPFLHEAFHLSELNGVLCLAHAAGAGDEGTSTSSSVVIWMTEDGVSPRWSKRCVFTSTSMFIPIALFHHGGGGGGGVIGKRGDLLFFLGDDDDGEDESRIGEGKEEEKQVVCLNGMTYHDDEQGRHTVVVGSSWENLHYYKLIPYTESLVPI